MAEIDFAIFNAGFAAYLGLPLKGHHTQEYIAGNIDGVTSYESDRGIVFGMDTSKASNNVLI